MKITFNVGLPPCLAASNSRRSNSAAFSCCRRTFSGSLIPRFSLSWRRLSAASSWMWRRAAWQRFYNKFFDIDLIWFSFSDAWPCYLFINESESLLHVMPCLQTIWILIYQIGLDDLVRLSLQTRWAQTTHYFTIICLQIIGQNTNFTSFNSIIIIFCLCCWQ